MFNRCRNNKGSFTLEAALIFPLIFMCIGVVMYVCILLYQHALVQALADRAVERSADTWNNPEKEITTGAVAKDKLKAGGLYWRLYDFNKQLKMDKLAHYINERIDQYTVLNSTNVVYPPELADYIAYKKLSVSVESKYRLPAAGVFKLFGVGEYYTVKVTSAAVINEPVEFIRNTELIVHTEQEIERRYPGIAQMGEKVRGAMEKIHEALSKFFD